MNTQFDNARKLVRLLDRALEKEDKDRAVRYADQIQRLLLRDEILDYDLTRELIGDVVHAST